MSKATFIAALKGMGIPGLVQVGTTLIAAVFYIAMRLSEFFNPGLKYPAAYYWAVIAVTFGGAVVGFVHFEMRQRKERQAKPKSL